MGQAANSSWTTNLSCVTYEESGDLIDEITGAFGTHFFLRAIKFWKLTAFWDVTTHVKTDKLVAYIKFSTLVHL
jgi:hypothetical protein